LAAVLPRTRRLRKEALRQLRAQKAKVARIKKRLGLTEATRRYHAAADVDTHATRALLQITPTSMAGVLALLRYVAACEGEGDEILMCYMNDHRDLLGYEALVLTVCNTLAAMEEHFPKLAQPAGQVAMLEAAE
jgi:hypothetical protein